MSSDNQRKASEKCGDGCFSLCKAERGEDSAGEGRGWAEKSSPPLFFFPLFAFCGYSMLRMCGGVRVCMHQMYGARFHATCTL